MIGKRNIKKIVAKYSQWEDTPTNPRITGYTILSRLPKRYGRQERKAIRKQFRDTWHPVCMRLIRLKNGEAAQEPFPVQASDLLACGIKPEDMLFNLEKDN